MSGHPIPAAITTVGELLARWKAPLSTTGLHGGNTPMNLWPRIPVEPGSRGVLIWHNFTWEKFHARWGHLLGHPVISVDPPVISNTLDDPAHAARLVERNAELLGAAVAFVRQSLNFPPDANFEQRCPVQQKGWSVQLPGHPNTTVHYFSAIVHGFEDCLVVGLVKPWWDAIHACSQAAEDRLSEQAILPLMQLAGDCLKVNTRYGFIQTATHLVACRFNARALVTGYERPVLGVEIMPVPWTNHGHGTLTTDLALFWLNALAAASGPHGRRIVSLNNMCGI